MKFICYIHQRTSSHVGYRLRKNILLRGAITGETMSGYHQKIAYCQKQNWIDFIFGAYFLGIVFLYGGHAHILNTKKELNGVTRRLFENMKKKEKVHILQKNKHLLFLREKNEPSDKNILLKGEKEGAVPLLFKKRFLQRIHKKIKNHKNPEVKELLLLSEKKIEFLRKKLLQIPSPSALSEKKAIKKVTVSQNSIKKSKNK